MLHLNVPMLVMVKDHVNLMMYVCAIKAGWEMIVDNDFVNLGEHMWMYLKVT